MFKKYIILKVFTLLFLALSCQLSYAQNVGINSSGAAPHASAGLDVDFTNKGFLAPRMTLAQRTAISSPATGLMVYQTDAPSGFYFYNGTTWVVFNSGAISGWSTTGNASTTPGTTHFLGTTDVKDFVFKTSNTERARILSGGNFGIGTTSPDEKLDVSGSAIIGTDGTTGRVKITNTSESGITDIFTADNTMLRISNNGMGQTGSSLQLKNGTENYLFSFEGRGGFRYYSRTTGNMGEKFRVNDEGDIYLTTTGENTAVDGQGNINDFYQLNVMNQNSGNNASSDVVATADNGDDTDAYIDMGINSSGYNSAINGVGNILNGPNVTYLYGNGEKMFVGNASRNKDLAFFTNSSSQDGGEDARGTERMTIKAAGNVLIGTTSDNGYKLRVNGDVYMDYLNYNGANNRSDRRLKTNIEPLKYGLNKIMTLNPVLYNWTKTPDTDKQLGLIAQEVRTIVPEIVKGDESKEMLTVNYTALIPVLINAIKEQQAQIEELKQQVQKLQK